MLNINSYYYDLHALLDAILLEPLCTDSNSLL